MLYRMHNVNKKVGTIFTVILNLFNISSLYNAWKQFKI